MEFFLRFKFISNFFVIDNDLKKFLNYFFRKKYFYILYLFIFLEFFNFFLKIN